MVAADTEAEIRSILAAAKAGDDAARHRATMLGRRLGGDAREKLFHEVDELLGEARRGKRQQP
jgi:hypothetical protein